MLGRLSPKTAQHAREELEEELVDFGAMRAGIFNYTREEYEELPVKTLNHIMGFFEGFRLKEEEERARARFRMGV